MRRKRFWALGALAAPVIALATALPAQDADEQKALIEKRDEKLASVFLKKASWLTDYDKARAAAKKTGNLIFAYFTRSYSP